MKSFVLLSKRTGNLCEGYRILFADGHEPLSQITKDSTIQINLRVADQFDGWIVCSTQAGGFKVFMNWGWVEEEFENLGEL